MTSLPFQIAGFAFAKLYMQEEMGKAFKERSPWARLAISEESILFTIACVIAIAKTVVLEINRSRLHWKEVL